MSSKKRSTSAATTVSQIVGKQASKVFDSVDDASIDPNSSYLRSYRSLRRYFEARPVLNADDFICAAHMVYGWMPTILSIGDAKPATLAALVDKARDGGELTDGELQNLATATNNSLVGASKILHFAAPKSFAIWDSRIHQFVFKQKSYQYRTNDITRYRTYMDVLRELQRSPRFPKFHTAVNLKVGYKVSGLLALELVMFQLGK